MADGTVILPMVLQIGETMVLQRGELEEKARSSYFWVFGQLTVLVGKHDFAEKLHFKLKWLLMRLELIQNFAVQIQRNIRNAASEL